VIWPFGNRTTEKIGLREPVWKVEPPRPWPDPPANRGGLSNREVSELAIYNAEVARGIVHTDKWKRRMSELQDRWNAGKAD
jgi:hypothetical protein